MRPKLHKHGAELTPCRNCDAPRYFQTFLSKTIGGRGGRKIHLTWCDTCIELYKENRERIARWPPFMPKEWIQKSRKVTTNV